MKGEFYNAERVYNIIQLPLFKTFLRNDECMKQLLKTLLSAVSLFNKYNIVHADLKLDNILVKRMGMFPTEFKVIDFGSTFNFRSNGSIHSVTPEYMPPEALVSGAQIQELAEISHPWSFDMWSIGMIFLEIANGFPLWMSLKSKVDTEEGVMFMKGLLAAPGRDPTRIIRMQYNMVNNLEKIPFIQHFIIN